MLQHLELSPCSPAAGQGDCPCPDLRQQQLTSMAMHPERNLGVQVAQGFIKVANEAMCRPIRALTQMRGYNVAHHVLSCFGGAGGQHACAIARSLGMRTIFVHRYSGVLSAVGIGLADMVAERQVTSLPPSRILHIHLLPWHTSMMPVVDGPHALHCKMQECMQVRRCLCWCSYPWLRNALKVAPTASKLAAHLLLCLSRRPARGVGTMFLVGQSSVKHQVTLEDFAQHFALASGGLIQCFTT